MLRCHIGTRAQGKECKIDFNVYVKASNSWFGLLPSPDVSGTYRSAKKTIRAIRHQIFFFC